MKMTSSAIRSACKLARMATVSINPVTLSHPVVLGGKIINKKENQARVHAPALKTRIKMDPFVRVPKRRVRVCIYIYLCVFVCLCAAAWVCVSRVVRCFPVAQWMHERQDTYIHNMRRPRHTQQVHEHTLTHTSTGFPPTDAGYVHQTAKSRRKRHMTRDVSRESYHSTVGQRKNDPRPAHFGV